MVVAFGQYAQMSHRAFLAAADGVAMDEPERVAGELAETAAAGRPLGAVPGMITGNGMTPKPPRRRIGITAPARDLFPSLVHYEAHHSPFGLMGNIEATRGAGWRGDRGGEDPAAQPESERLCRALGADRPG